MRSCTALALAALVVLVPTAKAFACTCDRPAAPERASCCAPEPAPAPACPGGAGILGDCPCTQKTPQATASDADLSAAPEPAGRRELSILEHPGLAGPPPAPLRRDPHPGIVLPLLI